MKQNPSKNTYFGAAVLIGVLVIGFAIYRYHSIAKERDRLKELVVNNEKDISSLQSSLSTTTQALINTAAEKNQYFALLTEEQRRSTTYRDKLDEVTNTADRLKRLSETDKELLSKYSRVFFLSENYVPAALTDIDTKFLSVKNRPLKIHDNVWPFLRDMLEAAQAANQTIEVVSAYRSFDTQTGLKSQYKVIYGAGTANQFSADQGYSEHQLGTTVDLTIPSIGTSLNNFEKSAAYTWLKNNAYRYGFILSYPPNNTYYQFEPWHWRFVGIALATRLHNENKNFYDLDQREVDTYLLDIFTKSQ